jgi:hypothetical protein
MRVIVVLLVFILTGCTNMKVKLVDLIKQNQDSLKYIDNKYDSLIEQVDKDHWHIVDSITSAEVQRSDPYHYGYLYYSISDYENERKYIIDSLDQVCDGCLGSLVGDGRYKMDLENEMEAKKKPFNNIDSLKLQLLKY